MEAEEINIVLTRASELHSKISDAIERSAKSDFVFGGNGGGRSPSTVLDQGMVSTSTASPNSRTGLISTNGLEIEPYQVPRFDSYMVEKCISINGSIEARSLGLIREALETLEDQLEQLQLVQQQQRYEKDAVLAELEESRRRLLQRLRDHQGVEWEIVHEVMSFAGEPLDGGQELLTGGLAQPSPPPLPPAIHPPPLPHVRTLPAPPTALFEPSRALVSSKPRSDMVVHSRMDAPPAATRLMTTSSGTDDYERVVERMGNNGIYYSSSRDVETSDEERRLSLASKPSGVVMMAGELHGNGEALRRAGTLLGHAVSFFRGAVVLSVRLVIVGATVTGLFVAGDAMFNGGGTRHRWGRGGGDFSSSSSSVSKGENNQSGVQGFGNVIRNLRGRRKRRENPVFPQEVHVGIGPGGGGGGGMQRMMAREPRDVSGRETSATKSPDVMSGRG